MATIDETLDEIFSKTDEEFLKEMEEQFQDTLKEMRKAIKEGIVTTEEAGKKLVESFDFEHYIKKEDWL